MFHRTDKGFQHVLSRISTLPDPRNVSLCVSDLLEADKIIVRWVQNRSFPEEILCLQSDEDSFLPQSNRLAPLSPILVDSILRVGGRIKNAPVTDDTKHPVILPADSPVSRLIIQKIHVETGHGGRDQVLSRLRQRYWVIHATSVCRQICKSCVSCRQHFGRMVQQQMADLPADRVNPDEPPFTSTGMDYFGSIQVKGGRSWVKRYGAIFTCSASQAVHIEVAASLDTNAFLNALRRFTARQGQVKIIISGNGTNIVGAQREL